MSLMRRVRSHESLFPRHHAIPMTHVESMPVMTHEQHASMFSRASMVPAPALVEERCRAMTRHPNELLNHTSEDDESFSACLLDEWVEIETEPMKNRWARNYAIFERITQDESSLSRYMDMLRRIRRQRKRTTPRVSL